MGSLGLGLKAKIFGLTENNNNNNRFSTLYLELYIPQLKKDQQIVSGSMKLQQH